MLLIGAIAGWIAGKVTDSNHSIFTNILVGIAGSFVAGHPEYPRVRLLSHFGGRNHRRHFDSVRVASSASTNMTR
jgi:uncharacterized membrane protein YeaQ/YmgE (transglycosylase-associated protein family)